MSSTSRKAALGVGAFLLLVLFLRSYSAAPAESGGETSTSSTTGTRKSTEDLGDTIQSSSNERIVILGSGVTGLGASYRLFELNHAKWDVYERDVVPGGLARSVTDENGFTWDEGVHVLFSHFNYFDSLLDHVLPVDEWEYHTRSSPIWMYDRFVGYPLQNNIWQLPPDPLMECLDGLVAVHDARVSGAEIPKPKNFLEWIEQSFGAGIVKYFMAPYNFKVWAHPPIELNSNWVGERVATIDLKRILSNLVHRTEDVHWGPNANFRYPTRGSGVVWERVFKALPRERFHFGKEAVEINLNNPQGKYVKFADGSIEKFDKLISTLPMNKMVQLLSNQPQLAAWGREEGSFKFQTVNLVGIGLEGTVPPAWNSTHWIYFPEDVYPFYRITILSNFSPYMTAKPGKQFSVLVEVSESKYRPVDQATLINDVIEGLMHATVVPRNAKIVSRWHNRFEYGYPVPYVERDFHVHRMDDKLVPLGIWSRGRFGNWKYEVANQDHSAMLGVEAVDNILFGTYEEILHEPNVVNGKKGERRIQTPKYKDQWDLVLRHDCGDTDPTTWLPAMVASLAKATIRSRVFVYNSCASVTIAANSVPQAELKVTSIDANQRVGFTFLSHVHRHYEDLWPVSFFLRASTGAPQHPAPGDFAITSDPATRAFRLYESSARTSDAQLCPFLEQMNIVCPAGAPRASSLHVSRGTIYRLLEKDFADAVAAAGAK